MLSFCTRERRPRTRRSGDSACQVGVKMMLWMISGINGPRQQLCTLERGGGSKVQSLPPYSSCRTMRCTLLRRPPCGRRAARCRPGCGSASSARTGKLHYKVRSMTEVLHRHTSL